MLNISHKYVPAIERVLQKKNKQRYLIVTGGRGSGKTYAMDRLIAMRLTMNNPDVIVYARYTLAGLRNGTLPTWRALMSEFSDIYMTNTAAYYGDSRIIFDGIKSSSPSKLKSIEGLSVFICDEASDIMREEEFDTIDQSMRAKDRDSLTILVLNPTTPDHWIYKRFFENVNFHQLEFAGKKYSYPIISNPNVCHIHTTFLDNLVNLNESFLNIAEETQRTNEQRFVNQYLGFFVDWDGARILNFELSKEIDRSLPCAIGVDFGYYPDPTAITRVYVNNKDKIIYVELLLYSHRISSVELSNEILKYSDYRIVCDTNIKAVTEPLRMNGLNIYYKNMRVELKQQLVKLSEYRIVVNDNFLINEISSYRWGKNEPLAGYGDHAIDSLRYAAYPIIMNDE